MKLPSMSLSALVDEISDAEKRYTQVVDRRVPAAADQSGIAA
jgi:hypothetical protein